MEDCKRLLERLRDSNYKRKSQGECEDSSTHFVFENLLEFLNKIVDWELHKTYRHRKYLPESFT